MTAIIIAFCAGFVVSGWCASFLVIGPQRRLIDNLIAHGYRIHPLLLFFVALPQ